jgi:AraC family transcriptional regulator
VGLSSAVGRARSLTANSQPSADPFVVIGTETLPGDALLSVIARLLDDAGRALERDRSAAKAYLERASALARAGREQGAAATAQRGVLAPWQIKRLTAFIDANLGSTICTADLTRIVGMSTGHFFRSFKRSFGEAPYAFVARRRMHRAQELMLTTNETLCQIALACGLCDQSHFTRVFRRVVGESPNAWRRRVTGHIDRSADSVSIAPMQVAVGLANRSY